MSVVRVITKCVTMVHTAIQFKNYSLTVFFVIAVDIIFTHHHLTVGQNVVYIYISRFPDKLYPFN